MRSLDLRTAVAIHDFEEDLAKRDYAWFLRWRVLSNTEAGWQSFRKGYAAGGEIGRRRYGRRALQLNEG